MKASTIYRLREMFSGEKEEKAKRKKVRSSFFVGRAGVRWASCSGLYSLVHSPRLNGSCETSRQAGNCAGFCRSGGEKLVSKQPGGKPLCHPRATSETILLQPSAFLILFFFFFFCGAPSSSLKPPPKKRDLGAAAPTTPLLWPPRGLEGG